MEIWRIIENYHNHEISNFGNIRSKDVVRIVKCRWGGLVQKKYKGKVLKPFKVGNYLGIRFVINDKNHYIHRLVAQHFVNGDASLFVNHKDGNKHNNHFENLEWVTGSQNMKHSTHVLGNTKGQFKKKGLSFV
jgi:hypothetical protein